VHPNALRYAAPTGRVLIRWDGARAPVVWTVPAPDVDPIDARLELARRYLHVFGPGTAKSFARWAGIKPPPAHAAFERLTPELVPVRTPIGDAWILAEDEAGLRAAPNAFKAVRLLPSGDTYYLLHGADREMLVPEPERRAALWTSRVWPGALLVGDEIVGTWRRAQADLAIQPWRPLTPTERRSVEEESAALPLPGIDGAIRVHWDTDQFLGSPGKT
jgi:Winged helix DNA-binding domain